MKNYIRSTVIASFVLMQSLSGTIHETTHIEDITQEVTDETLVLFNIAEVLLDTQTSLGTQAWRKYVRKRVDAKTHDALTLTVFELVPPISPDPKTPEIIKNLQKDGIPVLAFTSRGRHEWYSTQVKDVDHKTEHALKHVGIDFSATTLPSQLAQIETQFSDYYHNGIIYATNSNDKGEFLKNILETTGYRPAKIIFVDDKIDDLKAIEKEMEQLAIPFVGYAYNRTAKEHANFDPMIAHLQATWLLFYNKMVTDEHAAQLKAELYTKTDPEEFF